MKLYFVRHGESTYNALNLHQHGKVELSETGLKQAEFVAKRFEKIPIDIVVSSHFERAKKTAEIINKTVQKKLVLNEVLREYKRPTELENKPYTDSDSLHIKSLLKQHVNEENWHYSDEENFFDLKKRAQEFLKYIEQFKEESILVVTHGVIVRLVVCCMLWEDSFITPDLFFPLEHSLSIQNTGITLCEKDENGKWKLVTWNDHAHLG